MIPSINNKAACSASYPHLDSLLRPNAQHHSRILQAINSGGPFSFVRNNNFPCNSGVKVAIVLSDPVELGVLLAQEAHVVQGTRKGVSWDPTSV